MFIALSTFTIANDKATEVKQAFVNRLHLVDEAPGFISMNVSTPQDNPNEIWLMTHWTNEESFRVWYKSHHYHDSHAGIPPGVQLVPGSVKIRYFDQVC